MIKAFFLLASLLVNHCYSSESGETPSLYLPDKWGISSSAFSIYWGMKDEDTYISVIDCKAPTESRLILPNEITAENRTLFDRIHAKHLEEASNDKETFDDLARK